MLFLVQAARLFTGFRLDQLWKLETVRSNWTSFIFWTDRSGGLDITQPKRSTLMPDIQVS
jgi:hypothetical protein